MEQSGIAPVAAKDPLSFDHYPLHLTGLLQPHGVLLAFRHSDLEVLQVSSNLQEWLGIEPQSLLGHPLSVLLNTSQIEALQAALQQNLGRAANSTHHLKLSIPLPPQGKSTQAGSPELIPESRLFDGLVHSTADVVVLELEPAESATAEWVPNLHSQLKGAIAHLRQITDLSEFLQQAVEAVQTLTGCDRVLIYQFDEQQAGSVVAEAKAVDAQPYLGLHYPASDIPKNARALYRQGLVRFVPNIQAEPVELLPHHNSLHQRPLDLSRAVLRGVDRCCREYHQNMGVSAFLVISLIKDQQLWGLISCHHSTPKFLPYEVRSACEILGQFIASELTNKVNHEEIDHLLKLKAIQSNFVESIAQAEDFRQALIDPAPRLLDLVNAQGAAVCLDDEITLVGATPPLEQIQPLIEWADTQVSDSLFHTSSLPHLYPAAAAFHQVASGLLLLRISRVRCYFILWFRPEIIQTVNWAGNPNQTIRLKEDGVTLGPRTSFAQWQEAVRLTALPWKNSELENALDLRNAIVGIVLNKADELADINRELARSNRELDAFAFAASHDLKEPLRGIHNFSVLLLKGYANVLDEIGIHRLNTLVQLTRRMEALIDALLKFSRLGQTELHLQPTDLTFVVNRTVELVQASRQDQTVQPEIRIPRPLPTVQCDPVLVNEVFTNLLSNAFKYNDKPEQWIEIGYLNADEQLANGWIQQAQHASTPPVFWVRDNGIGIRDRHLENIFRLFKRLHEQDRYGGGTGAGLTIARKIVERHKGRMWVESTYGEGSTFYFTLG